MPNLILLWMAGVAVALGACSGIDLSTPEGQCKASRIGNLVLDSEAPDDADMQRRGDLAETIACPPAE